MDAEYDESTLRREIGLYEAEIARMQARETWALAPLIAVRLQRIEFLKGELAKLAAEQSTMEVTT